MPSLAASVQQPSLAYPNDFSLELLVPAASDFDTLSYIKQTPTTQLKTRDSLFFEELVPVKVIIHGSLDDKESKEILSRTEITITANATSAAPPPRAQHAPGDASAIEKPLKVSLDSVILDGGSDMLFYRAPDQSSKSHGIFNADLFLRYPTAKLHKPLVHFNVSAALKLPSANLPAASPDSEYLASGVPEAENLLGSLVQSVKSATPDGDLLSLPASRLIKVAPRASATSADTRPLRTSSKLLPILPILLVRVASTAATRMPEPIATLDLELTRYVSCSVDIQSVLVKGSHLNAECLTNTPQSSLVLCPGDRSSLMYRLSQITDVETANLNDHLLEIHITATAQLTKSCKPRLKVQWRGSVNPFFSKGPNHLPRPGSASSHLSQDVFTSRPASKHLSMTGRPRSMIGTDLGLTFAFSGPPSVHNGETFHLDIFIVNRSSRRKRLAIISVPHSIKALQSSTYGPRPFTADSAVSIWRHETAEAIAESKSLFNQQSRHQAEAAEVICLNADVRVGPLPPGTCHNVQLEFLALSRGFVGLSAIQIVDLESRETHEITDLPEIEVVGAAEETMDI